MDFYLCVFNAPCIYLQCSNTFTLRSPLLFSTTLRIFYQAMQKKKNAYEGHRIESARPIR